MLKKNRFDKKTKNTRKPDIAVLVLASLTVILLFAWGGLYWQERSANAEAVQGNDDTELPVIMLNLDAKEPEPEPKPESQPQGSDSGKGNESAADPEGLAAGQEPEKSQEDPAQSPQETDSDSQEASTSAPEKEATASGNGAAQSETPSSPAKTSTSKPTPKPATNKPSPTPANSEKPSAASTPKPSNTKPSQSTTPTPVESSEELVQRYESELLSLQAGCVKDVKSVIKEAETQMGNVDTSDSEAVQRIANEASLSLEAAGAACDSNFNEVAARASQDGVSAAQIAEWRQTYDEMMEQVQAEAELQLLT